MSFSSSDLFTRESILKKQIEDLKSELKTVKKQNSELQMEKKFSRHFWLDKIDQKILTTRTVKYEGNRIL